SRGLGARTRVHPAGRALLLRRDRGRHLRGPCHRRVARADDVPRRACTRVPSGRPWSAALARRSQRALRLDLRGPLPGDAGADRGGGLRRLRRAAAPVGADEAANRRRGIAAMRVVVVGGGLAGCAAAPELTKLGHEVTVLEARPTLGGAVQTLPAREGDPEPPPDNGQHIALGCFTEYLGFVEAIGQGGALRRSPLALPVIDADGRTAFIKPSLAPILRYSHLALGDRIRIVRTLLRLRRVDARAVDAESFCALLMLRLGESQRAVER